MTRPTTTKEKVIQTVRDGDLVKCHPDQYSEVRLWIVEEVVGCLYTGEFWVIANALTEIQRMDHEMGYDYL